jgi:hypothetical protein
MRNSGLATMLILAMIAIFALLALANPGSGPADLWDRITGRNSDTTAVSSGPVSHPDHRPMTGNDGMRQVEQAQRDMEAMQEMARSVGK